MKGALTKSTEIEEIIPLLFLLNGFVIIKTRIKLGVVHYIYK